jgi:beta-1,4-mannosyltransferase
MTTSVSPMDALPMLGRACHADALRVASVPSAHVYVQRVRPPGVELVADPTGDDGRCPLLLDPAWVRAHAAQFDLMHIHFGFQHCGRERIAAVADELAAAGVPLVFTVHDLRGGAGLAELLQRADELITLTEGAAVEIAMLCGRRPTVLGHPHVVPLERIRAVDRRRREAPRRVRRVGLHLESLTPDIAALPTLRALRRAIRSTGATTLRVDVHRDVTALEVRAELQVAQQVGDIELHVHDPFTDTQLWDYLESLDAFVLPYRLGTHSGLVEACHDLGVSVIAPSCGYYHEQGADHAYHLDGDGGCDEPSLVAAVRAAELLGARAPCDAVLRELEQMHVADAHMRLYHRALGRMGR